MTREILKFLYIILLLPPLFMPASCGKDSPTKPNPPEPPPPAAPVTTRIIITPSSVTLNAIGQTGQLTASVLDQNGTAISGATVIWTSSSPGVAIVNAQGLVTAVNNGTASITARSGTVTASIQITVKQDAVRITVEPESATLVSIGQTIELSALVLDQNGQPIADAVVTWQSSDETVATVSPDGLVTAVNNGTASFTARSGSASTSIDVTVSQHPDQVVVEPENVILTSIGDTVQLSSSVLDQNEHIVEGIVVDWTTSDSAIATVDTHGLVTAVSNGATQITAQLGNISATVQVSVEGPGSDRALLGELYTALNGTNWLNKDNWLSNAPLNEWHGVSASASGQVISLNLGNNNLQGSIPTSLSRFSSLRGLGLDGNRLTGQIPSELARLVNLTHLYLFDNQLHGPIPGELGELSRLVHLCLNGNSLTGGIPPELGRLSALRWLHLHDNLDLSGFLPDTLIELELEALLLHGTKLCVTTEPVFQTWLDGIRDLRLSRCNESHTDREVLIALYEATNGAGWTNNTNWLSEKPLETWFGVGTDSNGRITELNVKDNNLSGTIPPELGLLSKLTLLNLSDNGLTGHIPRQLGRLNNLKEIYLIRNLLSGSIPPELGRLTGLRTLSLSGNVLTGSIPVELGRMTSLRHLWLPYNKLTGAIPAELAKLTSLRHLDLANNRLTGPIPKELSRLYNLNILVLSRNSLTGSIPSEFGYFANLFSLQLNDNDLTGKIPTTLGLLRDLGILNIRGNIGLHGPLPPELTNLTQLSTLYMSETGLCVPPAPDFQAWINGIRFKTITTCETEPGDREVLTAFFNATGGTNWNDNEHWLSELAPSQWYGITTNDSGRVHGMNLESNNLQGGLPQELGNLTDLRTLILAGNAKLAGQLRLQMTSLALDTLLLAETQLCAPMDEFFQSWLREVSVSEVADCADQISDRAILTAFYNRTGGPTWTDNTNWLSERPLEEWFGVKSDGDRVLELNLRRNNLKGSLPTELSRLGALRRLDLSRNELSGGIPPELGNLGELRTLGLSENQLNGSIPPDLGRLERLEFIWIGNNQLTGTLPPELGQLHQVKRMWFDNNRLTGSIPTEFGQLADLYLLDLSTNNLTGIIPMELGQLQNLVKLYLHDNRLTGNVPWTLGNLASLKTLHLYNNRLTGTIPSAIGTLANVTEIRLDRNQLSGNIPSEIGSISSLNSLNLSFNTAMSGPIPQSLVGLGLTRLLLQGTQLCAPQSAGFQEWLRSIPNLQASNCIPIDRSAAYLIQATQSFEHPVPLVANRPALLRVFVAGMEEVTNRPSVKATFYQDDVEVFNANSPAEGFKTNDQIDESSLANSVNMLIPATVITPGLEMTVEIDSEDMSEPYTTTGVRIPDTGRMAVDVREMPLFDLTLVPLLWEENPDYSVITKTEGLTPEDDLFFTTRNLLPIQDFKLSVREPVYISVNPVFENRLAVGRATIATRTMDGANGYYVGILRSGGGSAVSRSVSVSGLYAETIAHELGHNLSLGHAPCGNPQTLDRNYPYEDGSIGAWGYDLSRGLLIPPEMSDLMSYCHPRWISDYSFSKALKYRLEREALHLASASLPFGRKLFVWGGLDEYGSLVLEPAFVIDALSSLPEASGGPYRLEGVDSDGNRLFQLGFAMDEIGDGEGGVFAFSIPIPQVWTERLERITLSGPEGYVEMARDGDRSAALLLESDSGKVRGILSDRPEGPTGVRAARRTLPESGLEAIYSSGIPDASDW